MKKVKRVFEFFGSLIIYAIPIFNVLFLYIFLNAEDAIPLYIYLQLNRSLPKLLFVGYCLFFPVLLLAKRELYFSPVLFIGVVPMFFLIFIIAGVSYRYENIESTAKYNNSIYHVTTKTIFDLGMEILFYKCDGFDLNCEKFEIVSHYQIDPNNYELIIDNELNEIHVAWEIEGEKKYVYTYGPQPRNIVESIKHKDQIYSLSTISGEEGKGYIYLFYECNVEYKGCQKLPFKYIKLNNDSPMPKSLIYNKSGEIQILGAHEELIYSYSDHPKCYILGCSIPQE